MGTRGLLGFIRDGEPTAEYNHYDSYTSGLGTVVCNWIADHTDAQILTFIKAANIIKSTDDNYRGRGEDVLATYFIDLRDDTSFAYDGYFCEWAYFINPYTKELEVYQGVKDEPIPSAGRFQKDAQLGVDCYPVHLVKNIKFADIRKAHANQSIDKLF